jgi:hypothetical protein
MRIESGNHDSSRPKRMPAVNQAAPRSAQSTARLLQSATPVFRVAVRRSLQAERIAKSWV